MAAWEAPPTLARMAFRGLEGPTFQNRRSAGFRLSGRKGVTSDLTPLQPIDFVQFLHKPGIEKYCAFIQ